jgi:hypothetical protein
LSSERGTTTNDNVGATDLPEHKLPEGTEIRSLTEAELAEVVWKATQRNIEAANPVTELSARRPYDAPHRIDVFMPGRWDTEGNYISMRTIDPNTRVFGTFKAPSSGDYLFVVKFTGFDITMKLSGPWGQNTGHTVELGDPGVVIGLSSASTDVSFFLMCDGQGTGVLQSIRISQLA